MKPARWASSSVFTALLLTFAPLVHAQEGVMRLDHAQFVLDDATDPPPDSAPWKPQALPDNWIFSRPSAFGYGWYKLAFDLPAQPREPYAIYTPWMRTIGAVYVNGVPAGRTAPFGSTQRSPYPAYFVIPQSLLHAGANTLHVRLGVNHGWRGALSPLVVGEDALVKPYYERRYFMQITGAEISTALTVALGLFMLMLRLRRRLESMYGYFGLGALCWAVTMTRLFVGDPPIPDFWWTVIYVAAQFAGTVFLCLFALRYAGLRWPWVERGLWAWAALSAVVYSIEGFEDLPGALTWIAMHWEFTSYPIVVAWLGILAWAGWRRRALERTLVLVAVVFIGGTFLRDLIAGELLGELDSPFNPYRALPICVALGWAMIDRFASSLNESERLNAELEQRVAHKHAELEQNFRRMHEMERQQAVVAERHRIMSDMHDGVGGHLISTLNLVEQGDLSPAEVATALRECLDDLRLTIDSLEPTDNDLLPVLGNLRYRLDGRMKKQGVELDWRVADVPKLACLTPQNVLHILRILQEALTNVLKHARASAVQVETGVDGADGHVYVRVRDNGRGFSGEHVGHGLANMRWRAQIIGADLEILPSPSGTTVSLVLPA